MLRTTLRTATQSASTGRRAYSSIKPVYTAHATSTGGRQGKTSAPEAGIPELTLGTPKGLGGKDDHSKSNPEALFASTYSACFIGAMGLAAGQLKAKLPPTVTAMADVSIGSPTDNSGGFKIAATLRIPFDSLEGSGLDRSGAEELLKKAHELCPYSRATRGNIEVDIKLE
ncbi:uncharacterized protein L969DRAFT_92151 [Mixia osmundae IAM 14324]|uniref:Organic hydroperoxide resistance protein n=1 Tax=Mixia osmundae (strain CBS 9802 / IAM 14324 / JCM 22182 / KY 12970) TaxID=764103 RepID=G7DT64_MIXOS|nr:uncharacterized protein L969DRAFT_92151 [Mixia osmundae IAM 14324]KEI42723.1 hypothetical protein L969DRAFT_92151 [Mixia osmundae IAM 14324]GAA93943.1 hypothetical protein E5Q_00589 [Mixia osmundae IAM 14324]